MYRQLKQAALQVAIRLGAPAFGGITFRPATDVDRRCGVRCGGVSAVYTGEPIPRWSVAFVDAAAFRTGPRRVAGIDADQRHAIQRRLISHESPQLGKSPTVVRSPLAFPNRCPFANVRQVFQPDAASGVFSLAHDYLADAVVHVRREACLFQSAALQKPLSRLGSFSLEFAPQPRVACPKVGVMGATKRFAVTVGGDVSLAKIDAKIRGGIAFRYVANIDGHVEEEHAVAVDKVSLPARTLKQSGLICAAHPWHDLPAVVGQDRDPVSTLPRQDALVVDDGAMRPEGRLDGLVPLVGFDDLGDGADGHLGAQSKVPPDVIVSDFLQFDLVRTLVGERDTSQSVARGIETLHRPEHGIGLLRRRQELQLHGKVHKKLYSKRSMQKQALSRVVRPLSLCRLKAPSSRGDPSETTKEASGLSDMFVAKCHRSWITHYEYLRQVWYQRLR